MKIKKGFMKRKIGEKYLVVATGALSREANMFIELNETSADIWDRIAAGCTAEETAQRLSDKYDVSYDKALADVKKQLAAMEDAGIFEEQSED